MVEKPMNASYVTAQIQSNTCTNFTGNARSNMYDNSNHCLYIYRTVKIPSICIRKAAQHFWVVYSYF